MTEEEAKLRWCPFARTTGKDPHQPSWNRVISGNGDYEAAIEGSQCIASACMAWRTEEPNPLKGHNVSDKLGFCGLAGQP